ncbi:MAG: DHA2 family efflux MFS transporter permease subunit [Capsulimonadaceae bacterium]|nr:DHA2 family efflux MFS transporter permease subunit [Capsulimonadaceae bacterium]
MTTTTQGGPLIPLPPRAPRPVLRPRVEVRPETPSPQPPLAPHAAPLNPYRWTILIAVLTGAFLELLDSTSVNVALRDMAGNLGATSDEIAWVVTGYILANVIVLPMTAWLSGMFGRRRYLFYSIMLFTIASLFCGASHTLGELVFWRIMQGAGGAALLSTAQATLREVFPVEQQGMIQALYIVVVVIGPTLGPTFGGWITDNYAWPMIFFVKAPIGFVAAFLVWRFLEDSAHQSAPPSIDWAGIALMTIGLGSLQYVLEEGERYDWFNDSVIAGLTILSAATLTAFVAWELSPLNGHPVVNLRILRRMALTSGVVLLAIGGFGMYGGTFILPLFTQQILGFSPTTSGLIFLPGGLATIVTSVLCGRVLQAANPVNSARPLIALGLVGFAASMLLLGYQTPNSGMLEMQIGLIIRGASMGLLLTPITVASLSCLTGAEIAQGAGLTNLFRQLGGSFGIAIINTYVTQMTDTHRSYLVANIRLTSMEYLTRHAQIVQRLEVFGYSPVSAAAASLGVVDHAVQTQARMLAYNDAFQLIGLAFLFALPVLLLLRRGAKSAKGL